MKFESSRVRFFAARDSCDHCALAEIPNQRIRTSLTNYDAYDLRSNAASVKSKACVVATIVLLGGCLVSGDAQPPEPLPSPATGDDQSDLILIPVEPPSLIEEKPFEQGPFPSQSFKLAPPPVFEPVLPPLRRPSSKPGELLSTVRVFVRKFQITGNHIFSNETLLKVIQKVQRAGDHGGRTRTSAPGFDPVLHQSRLYQFRRHASGSKRRERRHYFPNRRRNSLAY